MKVLGYDVNRRFEITLHSLEPLGTLLQQLLSLENVTGIHASFDRADQKKIETELAAPACADARTEAEQITSGVGVQLGPASAVSQESLQEIEGRFFSGASRYTRHFKNGEKELLFLPSTITIREASERHFQATGKRMKNMPQLSFERAAGSRQGFLSFSSLRPPLNG